METVIFIFKGKKLSILCKKSDKMIDICNNFSSRIGISINSLYFEYLEKPLNLELTFEEEANLFNKVRNNMYIYAFDRKIKHNLYKNEGKINNELIIKYKNNKNQNKIKIFGKLFVDNNKATYKIIYEHTIYELNEYFNLPISSKNKDIFEIKLSGIENITNMSYMFYDCESLLSIGENSNLNTNNVIDMSWAFYNCISLISLPNISKWNTNNVTDISFMFYNCKILFSLPDISDWNTSNVNNMSRIFYNCESLISIPDISKWNTINTTNMSCMFFGCQSLLSLPDISKWNTQNVIDMNCMFYNCKSLKFLPDISKWDTNKLSNIKNLFFGCNIIL